MGLSKLSKRQKSILLFISQLDKEKNATRLVQEISASINCANSTTWNVLRSLRNLKLAEFGSKENKGCKISLTKSGKLIVGGIKENGF